MKKQAASAALLIAMLASLAGCGGESAAADTTLPDTTAPAPAESEAAYSLSKYIKPQDLGGFQYTILSFNEPAIKSIYVEEENGSIIDDAVAAKIRTVEEHLNCDIVLSELSKTENVTGLTETKTSVMSGEYEFDLVLAHDISLADTSLEGLYVNVMELDAFDFDAEWWPQKTIENMRVGNKMYLMSNNVSYYPASDLRAMFFNKKMMADFNFDSPYQLVYDGTWTYDKMNEMVSGVYRDVNGDTKRDASDIYGVINSQSYYAWLESFGMEYYIESADGTLTYNFDLDKNSRIVEKIHDLLFTSGGGYITTDGPEAIKMFTENQSLFYYAKMSNAVLDFSFTDVQYGILPMPKLDSTQTEYYGGCTDKPSAIPVTVPKENLDKVALITEAMNIEGYYSVFPVYYETALKTRYSDQTDDAKMVDIIYDNRILSFTYLYGGHTGPYMKLLSTLLAKDNPSTDVASFAASHKSSQDEYMKKLNEFFAD